jgi:DNA adenine methylase
MNAKNAAAALDQTGYPFPGTLMKYAGSKNRLAGDIISLFPPRYNTMTYLEPFFGSGAVFFKKIPGVVETVNDIDSDIYNLFYQIRHNARELARLIEFTPWSREEYETSYARSDSNIENARRFLIRCWFSIGYASAGKYGWRHNIQNRNAGGHHAFNNILPDCIMEASKRLTPKPGNDVQIEHLDAFRLIEKYNRPNVLMYLDPPYLLPSGRNVYRFTMNDEDHTRLCTIISSSRAKIVLSGYASEIYDSHLPGFNKTFLKTTDEAGNQKTETVWRNFRNPGSLFEEF